MRVGGSNETVLQQNALWTYELEGSRYQYNARERSSNRSDRSLLRFLGRLDSKGIQRSV